MHYHPFGLEEWQSRYEQQVEINLADSGVMPVTMRELTELGADLEPLFDLPLHYPEVNGTELLRYRIASLYEGVSPGQVLVTVGASEANAITVETLVHTGDKVVVMTPSYAQVEGMVRNRGADVTTFPLDRDRDWRPDLDALDAAVTPETRLIALAHPNNPTGRILDADEMVRVVEIARRVGAWLLSDEVYRGSELSTDVETPTFVGRYDRVVSIGSLSKAYGLPGLRVGWIVAPVELVDALWRRHEYATIATAGPSMLIAEAALEQAVRERLLCRNRRLIRQSLVTFASWAAEHSDLVSVVSPQATALAFPRILSGESSVAVAHRIREQARVLVAPGACFGLDDHFRITHGLNPSRLSEALGRIGGVLRA